MLFVPYQDESNKINIIQSIRNDEYVLFRLTSTMIEKNNIDANEIFRDFLMKKGIVDYDEIFSGGENGIKKTAIFIENKKVDHVYLNFYKVANKRGDKRFSIQMIRKKNREHRLNVGDLIYISAYRNSEGNMTLYFVNITNNTPSKEEMKKVIGFDEINCKLEQLLPRLKEILKGGYYNNSKGKGDKSPKDIGDTLEYLLNIPTNNSPKADIDGLIEIKTKGELKSLDTLFTLRPCFDDTPISKIELNDRKRVSAFTREYGYDSNKYIGYNSLYITIGSEDAPQNTRGFYLEVDEDNSCVNVKYKNKDKGCTETVAFWSFQELKTKLNEKHPSTLWITAKTRKVGDIYQFKYEKIEFTRSPKFITFLTLIKSGIITYDWRGYTTKKGSYSGKNHGNAWRIKAQYRRYLFGEIEKIKL